MVVEQKKLALIFVSSVALGVFFGVIYSLFKVRRTYFPFKLFNLSKNKSVFVIEEIITFFEDVLFALICAVSTCVFIYYTNAGRFRGIALIGSALGYLIYYNTLGKIVLKCSGYIINFLRALIRKIILLTVVPVLKLLRLIFVLTLGRVVSALYSSVRKSAEIWAADKGFWIIRKKGRLENEETVKYFHKSGGIRVHRVLHGHNNKNAV